MNKKPLLIALALLLAAATYSGWSYYQTHHAPTRVALVNFMDFQYDRFLEVNDNPKITIDRLTLGDGVFPDISDYQAAFFFAHGNINLTTDDRQTIANARDAGTKIFFHSPTPMLDLSSVTPEESQYLKTALQNGGTLNLQRVLNYTRRVLDGKSAHSTEVEAPYVFPTDYFYHLEEENVFETLEGYEAFLRETGRFQEGGPKVAFISQILGLESGGGFIRPMVEQLEARGMNVYPISGFGQRLAMLKAVSPDLVVFMPHGRMAGDAGVAWLKEQNIPLLSPISVFAPQNTWQEDDRGMDGGMLSQNIVMAELDGGIVPYAVAAQFANERGNFVFKNLPGRVESFVDLAQRFIALQTKPNADKKVVVFYYKEAGRNAMVAEGLEIAPSLLKLLQRLQADGYTVGDMPADADALYERIQREGPVIGSYAKATLADFYANGNPALIPEDTLRSWIAKHLSPQRIAALEEELGPLAQSPMSVVRDGTPHLAVARVTFGNVVLMPVPPAGYGDDDVSLVHGVKQPPPYPYIGGYLWAKEGYKADAIVHFGTHGSVEFTPGKQVALADDDWPHVLTAGVPHFYLYSMSNIGEALVAKRRTYATMTTHITPPFMASGIYDDLQRLHDALDRYRSVEDPLLKTRYLQTARQTMAALDMDKDLKIDDIDTVELDNDRLLDIHAYMHELEQAKVTNGLHVLGRSYSDEETYETVQLMAIDYLAHTMAQLDELDGKITSEQAGDSHVILEQYREPALAMIEAVYHGHAEPESFFAKSQDTALSIHKPHTVGHTHADGTTHTHAAAAGQSHDHGDDAAHAGHPNHGAHEGQEGQEGHGHDHPHGNPTDGHSPTGAHDGMLAPLRDAAGTAVGLVELKLHDDKGDLELWLLQPDGRTPYDLPADTNIRVAFETVTHDKTKNGHAVTLAVRNRDQNEDEDGVANLRPGHQTHYFIFPGDTGADATWLQGAAFEATVLVSFIHDQAPVRTDAFVLTAHTHTGGHEHGDDHDGAHDGGHAHGASADPPSAAAQSAERSAELRARPTENPGARFGYHRPTPADEAPVDPAVLKRAELEATFLETLESITAYREAIQASPQRELDAMVTGLAGGYIEPQSGGDPVVNPSAVPSGRNLTGIDAERTPTPEAWDVGRDLVDQLLAAKLAETGAYPKKVGFSLWSSEFVRQEGITLAEILYLLGVEPVRNRRGTVHDVKLIPAQELGRPRIDVVVQTSGQFRDLGASRIYLINKAVAMAAAADDATDALPNHVHTGAVAAEAMMKTRGISPAEAKTLATYRVFGGLNGNYGAGIMGMVESGDTWDDETQVAQTYLKNMGAVYGRDRWGAFHPGMFEAALQNTDTVLHPRSSNTWGPLSLDHVYEFMGGLSLAIQHATGEEPSTYFSDLRNPTLPVVQDAKKAVWQETRTTLLNPKYIAAMQEEGPSAADAFAETFRNTFGWDVMQSSMIDEEIWDKYEEVYVQDIHNLDIQQFFRDKNPYALQEMTAIMLETHRKGYWNPSPETLARVANLHVELVDAFEAGCSGFVCDNGKLSALIAQIVGEADPAVAQAYTAQIDAIRNAPAPQEEVAQGMALEETSDTPPKEQRPEANTPSPPLVRQAWIPAAAIGGLLVVVGAAVIRKRRSAA